MAGIDYEVEYNNRARVPEHAEIFARWSRDAEFYRAEALKAGHAELGLSYGDTDRQSLDLFFPRATQNPPLALFIHGGWWRSLDPSMFSHLARGLNEHGVTVAVAGYDLCPNVTIGDIVVQIRRACIFLWQRFGQRTLAVGHSAGGHLTAAMVATNWREEFPKAPADLVPAGYAISGVFDLLPLLHISANEDFRLDEASARALSPALWPVASGRVFDAIVGGLESNEFKRQSQTIASAWQGPARTRYEEISGTNHFTVLDPLNDPSSPMVARIVQLARQIGT